MSAAEAVTGGGVSAPEIQLLLLSADIAYRAPRTAQLVVRSITAAALLVAALTWAYDGALLTSTIRPLVR